MSDNGTNFIGAEQELRKGFHRAIKDQTLKNYYMEWKFIPPHAPEFGGLWEVCKFHLKRIVGDAHLTYEEMLTYTSMVESVLNSRPLLPLSHSPDDLNPLTPGHFLIGEPLTAIPEGDMQNTTLNKLSRWHRVQHMFQTFWTRWSKEYLSSLQLRLKATKKSENLQVGQLVLLKDEKTPPLKWPFARVCNNHPGSDGLTRVVSVRTVNGILKRPVTKICPLPRGYDE